MSTKNTVPLHNPDTPPKDQNRKDRASLLNPNIAQRKASNPESSVWVSASAGSGKTKVLTERVIRLLLPRENGDAGSAPEKILCITFTKAAAAEMAIRINETLGQWSIISNDKLTQKLTDLLGVSPTTQQINEARKLFARVIDTPGGLKIMTIHSFCQSILSRFPLEAELPPHFEVLDEHDASDLINQARNLYFKKNQNDKNNHAQKAMAILATHKNEEQFSNILSDLLSERRQLRIILDQHGSHDTLNSSYSELFKIPDHTSSENDITKNACSDESFDKYGLYELVKALSNGGKKDQDSGVRIQLWLDNNLEYRIENFEDYKLSLLTKTDSKPKSLSKGTTESNPHAVEIHARECERIINIDNLKNALTNCQLTSHIMTVGKGILDEYEALKKQQAVLDFDDMILRTLDLLSGKTIKDMENNPAAWILFKLDQGLDHILLDEAQDTNPEQWEIIRILADEFFHGYSSRDEVNRTIFVVGDEKQSIYSFQRANPDTFHTMRQYFANRIKQAGRDWQNVQMNTSFRSAQSILATVDETFNKPELKQGLGIEADSELRHNSFFAKRGGTVEIWPLIEPVDKQKNEDWAPPTRIIDNTPTEAKLANNIAHTVSQWIKSKKILPSKGRPIEPQDIMVLVKSRSSIVNHIIKALKRYDIPVSGADRLTLSEDLAIQDLISTAEFALLPDDDLSLACLLKSPIIGWGEDQLMSLSLNRGTKSLWQKLKESENENKKLVDFLENLIQQAGQTLPYEFFNNLLMSVHPLYNQSYILLSMIERLGNDIQDTVDAFLNLCLNFENEHTPTLKNFIAWHQNDKRQIKREMEEASSAVRLMTVHGSKGLQAPIVFLPDLIPSTNKSRETRLLWPDKTDLPLPIWSPTRKNDSPLYEDAYNKISLKDYQEYLRLLYVAMTRAEDQLYITGFKKRNGRTDESWMSLISDSVNRLKNRDNWKNLTINTTDQDESLLIDSDHRASMSQKSDQKQKWVITNKQISENTDIIENEPIEKVTYPIPEWLNKEAPKESEPPRTLTPSKALSEPAPIASPLITSKKNLYFLRGNITHKLLQILPDLPNDSWMDTAINFVSKSGKDLSKSIKDEIIKETLSVLNDNKFAPVFGTESRAEVPITSLINNQLISGQIDRLVITESEILIVDFKTNRPSPESEADVPPQYIVQLKSYRDTLAKTHPRHNIRCALLWTDKPNLQHITQLDT